MKFFDKLFWASKMAFNLNFGNLVAGKCFRCNYYNKKAKPYRKCEKHQKFMFQINNYDLEKC